MADTMEGLETRLLINGARVQGEGAPLEIFNPFTGEKILDIPSASKEQVDEAVRAAAEAFPAWRATPPGERARMLGELAAHIEAETDSYAALECLNTGKPYFITRNFADVPTAVESIRFLSQNARSLPVPAANEYIPGHLSMVRREPVGVCALNPPWNYPLMISSIILSAALASGNTVVLKPAHPPPVAPEARGRDQRDFSKGRLQPRRRCWPHTELVAGGKAGPRGFFHEPTVIAHARQDDDIVRNEVFGPVASITRSTPWNRPSHGPMIATSASLPRYSRETLTRRWPPYRNCTSASPGSTLTSR